MSAFLNSKTLTRLAVFIPLATFFSISPAHANCVIAVSGSGSLLIVIVLIFAFGYMLAPLCLKVRAIYAAKAGPRYTTAKKTEPFMRFSAVFAGMLLSLCLIFIFASLKPLFQMGYSGSMASGYDVKIDYHKFKYYLFSDILGLLSLAAMAFLYKKSLLRVTRLMPLLVLLLPMATYSHTSFYIKKTYYSVASPCCDIPEPDIFALAFRDMCPKSKYHLARCRDCTKLQD